LFFVSVQSIEFLKNLQDEHDKQDIIGDFLCYYTQISSRIEILTRSRPEFEPGEAGAEAAQLEQVERCRRVSNSEADDAVKNQFLNLFGYI